MASYIKIGGEIKNRIQGRIAEILSKIGYQVALEAYKKARFSGWQHDTYNLHDSYGSAVYINGVFVEGSMKYVNRARSRKNKNRTFRVGRALMGTGREALEHFFRHAWVVRKSDTITVIVAAAMWYGEYLEDKGFEVLDSEFVKKEIKNRVDKDPELLQMLKDEFGITTTTARRWLGIDEEKVYEL